MNTINMPFIIDTELNNSRVRLAISHTSETFDFYFGDKNVSIINNGDNSWSTVQGNIDQETVNIIGAEIERHYANLPL